MSVPYFGSFKILEPMSLSSNIVIEFDTTGYIFLILVSDCRIGDMFVKLQIKYFPQDRYVLSLKPHVKLFDYYLE